jgi:hypothetical protein
MKKDIEKQKSGFWSFTGRSFGRKAAFVRAPARIAGRDTSPVRKRVTSVPNLDSFIDELKTTIHNLYVEAQQREENVLQGTDFDVLLIAGVPYSRMFKQDNVLSDPLKLGTVKRMRAFPLACIVYESYGKTLSSFPRDEKTSKFIVDLLTHHDQFVRFVSALMFLMDTMDVSAWKTETETLSSWYTDQANYNFWSATFGFLGEISVEHRGLPEFRISLASQKWTKQVFTECGIRLKGIPHIEIGTVDRYIIGMFTGDMEARSDDPQWQPRHASPWQSFLACKFVNMQHQNIGLLYFVRIYMKLTLPKADFKRYVGKNWLASVQKYIKVIDPAYSMSALNIPIPANPPAKGQETFQDDPFIEESE